MNIIIYGTFTVLAVLLIAQVGYVFIKINRSQKNTVSSFRTEYPADVLEHGEKSIQAVINGEIKKQLIENDASLYNSAKALHQYSEFIKESTIYKKIFILKGSRYNG